MLDGLEVIIVEIFALFYRLTHLGTLSSLVNSEWLRSNYRGDLSISFQAHYTLSTLLHA